MYNMQKEGMKKLSSYRITILRTIIQIISFLLIFGGAFGLAHTFIVLPIMAPAGNPYTTVAGAWQLFEIMITAAIFPFLALAVILIASITVGRFFCGWVCPFGFISDVVSYVGKKKRVSFKVNDSLYEFALFIAILFLFIDFSIGYRQAIGASIYDYFGDFAREPFSIIDPTSTLFSMLFWYFYLEKYPKSFEDFIYLIEYPHAFWIRVILLLLAILLNLYIPRWWCRWICPLGAIKGIGSRYKLVKVWIDGKRCIGEKCALCEKACPMGVPILQYKDKGHIAHPLCISCLRCAEVCPYRAIRVKI